MSSEWPQIKLGEICKKITDGAHNSPKTVAVGKPMASVKDLTRFGVDLSQARLIPLEDFNALVKQGCKPEVGDVLIAKDGNSALDTVCNVDRPIEAVLLSSVAILRPDPERLDSHYLKHYLSSPDVIEYLKANFISGAAIPRVVLKDFKKAEITVPPLQTQRAIASVLDTLDDRITLLRETNATLEAIAQALFKSWFVDFDPVRARMEGRVPEGMDEATAALFPDSFEETKLGVVPRGWRIGKLGDIATLRGGKQLSKDAFSDHAPNPVFGGAGVMGYTAHRNATDFVITVGRVGAYCGQFYWHIGDAWVNNNASHIVPLSMVSSEWLLLWLKSVNMDAIKKGAAQPFVSNGDIAELPIVPPPIELVHAFETVVAPMFARSQVLLQQCVELASLRDTLLPRLISGQLRIDDLLEVVNA